MSQLRLNLYCHQTGFELIPLLGKHPFNRHVSRLYRKLYRLNLIAATGPKVTELRPTLTVNEGANIKLKCKVSGTPTPEVTWLKNGLPLRPNFRFNVKTKK